MFYLHDFATIVPNSIIVGDKNTPWQHISIDSRTIEEGDLFLALAGEQYDGHQFIKEACNKGACGVVLEKTFFQEHQSLATELKQPLLLVDNTLSALQLWAHYYHSLFKPLSICITGSNGKTTTKEMIVQLLSSKYHVLKSEGNYNNEIGVPLTVLGLASYHDVLVMEMAAQRLGEIKELTDIVHPDIAVITNIGEAHIGLFKNKANIARAKSELLFGLKDKGTAVLNRDDSYFDFLVSCLSTHNEVISFGFHPEAQVRAINFWQKNEKELHFELIVDKDHFQVFLPLLGRFNVSNALAAIAVGIKMKVPLKEILENISNFKGTELHMEYLLLDRGITLIQDYYNANPTATKEALESVASISEGRLKIAVLGDMLELGHDSVYYHKEIGRVVASLSYDILIAYGEFGQYISEGAREQGMRKDQIYYFNKEEESKLVNWLIKSAPEYSIILLKGSRKMQMENIVQFWKENIKLKGNINDN